MVATASPRSADSVTAADADEVIDHTSSPVVHAVTEPVDVLLNLASASPEQFARVRDRATRDDIEVVAMPQLAQATRVFAEVEAGVAADGDPELLAVAVVGPRNAVSRIADTLPLYGLSEV